MQDHARAATIKEFETIARLETQANDAYNDFPSVYLCVGGKRSIVQDVYTFHSVNNENNHGHITVQLVLIRYIASSLMLSSDCNESEEVVVRLGNVSRQWTENKVLTSCA